VADVRFDRLTGRARALLFPMRIVKEAIDVRVPVGLIGVALSALSAGLAFGQTVAPAPTAAVEPSGQAAGAAAPPFKPTLTIGGYLQGELDVGAVGDSRFPASDRFFVRRARITASGTAMPNLIYRFQAEFAGGLGSTSGITASLTDGYIEWAKIPEAHIRFGQFKSPYGRERLGASTQLPTIERSLVSDRLALNRQIGVEALGNVFDGRVGYLAAVVNGNGRNTTVNDNRDFMYIVRGNSTVWRAASVGRFEIGANAFSSRDTKLPVPGEFKLDSTPDTPGADDLFTGRHSGAGVDETFERGVWSVDAEWLRARFEPDAAGAPVVTAQGWYVTPGAFVFRRLVQTVGRYEWYRPDVHVDGNATSTWTVGVNYYARADTAKLMVDYLWVNTPTSTDHAKLLARVQVLF
jgi:phosphate-selective porin